MDVRLSPPADDETLEVVVAAAAKAGVALDARPAGYASAWRQASLFEGVERAPGPAEASPVAASLA